MLPERLSTDLTSLNDGAGSPVGRHRVRGVAGRGAEGVRRLRRAASATTRSSPTTASAPGWRAAGRCRRRPRRWPGMDEQLRMQDGVAQALDRVRARARRARVPDHRGASTSSTATRCTMCSAKAPNRAKALIENLMIAANGVTARFLDERGFPSLRRVVKSPERWDRIRALAEQLGDDLPPRGRLDRAGGVSRSAQGGRSATFPGSVDQRHPAARLAASTSSIRRARSRRDISVSRCATTRTRRRRTGAFPIS